MTEAKKHRTRPRSPREDRGTFAMFVVLFTPLVLLLAGLVVDGGFAIHARERALDVAEQAARAGADEIDEDELRDTGKITLDQGAAVATCADFGAAYDGDYAIYCEPAGADGVTAHTSITVQPVLLGALGLSWPVNVQVTAHAEDGE